MNLDAIIAELENFQEGVLPRKALQEAIANQDTITPVLLQALEDAKTNIQRLVDDPDYMLPTYAFYLLAQFREPKAYQPIIEFFSIPGDAPYDVTQEFVTTDLGRVLASVCDGEVEPIKQLIETPILNKSIRSAGLSAFTTLMIEGVLTREEVLDYFQYLFETLNQDSSYMLTLLTTHAVEIYPNDAILESVQAAFDNNVIESFFICRNDVKHFQNLGLKGCLSELQDNKFYHFVQDTIAEIEGWACFRDQTITPPSKPITFPSNASFPQEIRVLTHPKPSPNSSQQVKRKVKSKKSPLREAQGFATPSNPKKSSKKKKGFKT